MGSTSDLPIMKQAAAILKELDVAYEMTVVSAHRTPDRMLEYARTAKERGIRVIVAGAGGAAHLPGMVASLTTLPVVGVPIHSSNSILDGLDSLFSIVQMPGGIPVATVAVDGGKNAGILAARILSVADEALSQRLVDYQQSLQDKVMRSIETMDEHL